MSQLGAQGCGDVHYLSREALARNVDGHTYAYHEECHPFLFCPHLGEYAGDLFIADDHVVGPLYERWKMRHIADGLSDGGGACQSYTMRLVWHDGRSEDQ